MNMNDDMNDKIDKNGNMKNMNCMNWHDLINNKNYFKITAIFLPAHLYKRDILMASTSIISDTHDSSLSDCMLKANCKAHFSNFDQVIAKTVTILPHI
jgi:hypothetical protein